MWPFKKKPGEIPAQIAESWSMFHGEYDGKPLIARANVGLKPFIGHPNYSRQVGIAIPFHSPDSNGLPAPEESAQLMDIEDKICDELTGENESLFALVITTNGMREFVFYTSNPDSVERKLGHLRQTISSHTVQGVIRDDKDWSVYQQFVK